MNVKGVCKTKERQNKGKSNTKLRVWCPSNQGAWANQKQGICVHAGRPHSQGSMCTCGWGGFRGQHSSPSSSGIKGKKKWPSLCPCLHIVRFSDRVFKGLSDMVSWPWSCLLDQVSKTPLRSGISWLRDGHAVGKVKSFFIVFSEN